MDCGDARRERLAVHMVHVAVVTPPSARNINIRRGPAVCELMYMGYHLLTTDFGGGVQVDKIFHCCMT